MPSSIPRRRLVHDRSGGPDRRVRGGGPSPAACSPAASPAYCLRVAGAPHRQRLGQGVGSQSAPGTRGRRARGGAIRATSHRRNASSTPRAEADGSSVTVKTRSKLGSLLELVVIVAVALGLALLIQALLVKPYRIPTASMEPTLT